MATSQAAAEPLSTQAPAFSRASRPIGRGHAAKPQGSESPVRRAEREALRRRLLQMILLNEQLRRARPR
jgi:hypothetical protein